MRKANEDYQQRTESPGAVNPRETTFVFVTPRSWDSRSLEDWRAQKQRDGQWKDVRAIDGVALEEWLSQHPAVASKLAREVLGVFPNTGARSIAEYWDEYSSRFEPPLDGAVLLCDRQERAKLLTEQMLGAPQPVVVRADSTDEVVAFVIVTIHAAEENVRKFLEARTLVLDTEDAARQIGQKSNMVFIVRGSAVRLHGWLARTSVTIVPTGRDAPGRTGFIGLDRPSTRALSDALRSMGFDEDKAYQLARKSGRSVTVLGRQIPHGDGGRPEWVGTGRTLIPALLAGGWNGDAPQDQAIVTLLAEGLEYARYEAALQPLERQQDPPIDREANVWKVRAPVDAFLHLGYLIGRGDLQRLREAATKVFAEYDPVLDLSEDERPYAAIKGKVLAHSEWLRDGLATVLLLIAVLHAEVGLTIAGTTPQDFVDSLVRALPGLNRDYRVIASLRDELPLLMEAAPRPLLSALEQMLEGDGELIRPIFSESGLLGPSSPHTYLLWGLETLAWDPAYLSRVALILAKLARVDPGGKLHNRPLNSLGEIFLPWHPGTNAPLAERLAILDQIMAAEPTIGWRLLVSLLPEQQGVAHPTARPRFREAGASERELLTWGVVRRGYSEIISRALNHVDDNPTRWTTIIEELSNFEPALRERACDLLQDFIRRGAAGRQHQLWEVLRRTVNRHRAFHDAEWALRGPDLARLEVILDALAPESLVERTAWLFDQDYPDVPPRGRESHIDLVEEMRREAVEEIVQAVGAAGLIELATSVDCPQFVASAATAFIDIDRSESLIDASLGVSERLSAFALALSGEARRRDGDLWKERLLELARERSWTADQKAILLLGWPDEQATWQTAALLGAEVEKSYWLRKMPWGLKGSLDELMAASRSYLAVGRASAALGALHGRITEFPAPLALELIDGVIDELASARTKPNTMVVYPLEQALEALSARPDVPLIELARREYALLPALGYRERTLNIHRYMAQNPEFFVGILTDVFRAKSGERVEPTAEQIARAEVGYRLLSSSRLVPGAIGNDVDGTTLRNWVNAVRTEAARVDRSDIADEYVGHMLAHSPTDPTDGGWPHRVVRDLIEALHSEKIEIGIQVERFNMRGVVSKAMFEGGRQERVLAEQCREWAEKAAAKPRTAALLRDLAERWEREAISEDRRARQDEMRFE
ncbi:MAG: hypothetical protein HY527_10370 [Betaproteobacteria bacterium]|nr:hypothetical protein [Betaproteobacteria bacterium]